MIPEMTHELSSHWKQPSINEIEIDEAYALMNKETLNKLNEYSCSQPSGVYEGKMWKRRNKKDWFLMWFGESDDPKKCSVNSRQILINGEED